MGAVDSLTHAILTASVRGNRTELRSPVFHLSGTAEGNSDIQEY